MKLTLAILIVIVFAWCCFGCEGMGGGGNSVDPNRTHQIDTLPDSLRVKDTIGNGYLQTEFHFVVFYDANSIARFMTIDEYEIYQIRKRKTGQ